MTPVAGRPPQPVTSAVARWRAGSDAAIRRLGGLARPVWVGGALVVAGLPCLSGLMLFVLPVQDELERLQTQIASLEARLPTLQSAREQGLRRREEHRQWEQLHEQAMAGLPDGAALQALMAGISREARAAGLQIEEYRVQKDEPDGTHAVRELRLRMQGRYAQVRVFLGRLAEVAPAGRLAIGDLDLQIAGQDRGREPTLVLAATLRIPHAGQSTAQEEVT